MNLVIILTVCTVLLLYCNHSWQLVALATELEIQRAMHLQNFYRCEGLLNYGKILFQQNYFELKELEKPAASTKKNQNSVSNKKVNNKSNSQANNQKIVISKIGQLNSTDLSDASNSKILYFGAWPLPSLALTTTEITKQVKLVDKLVGMRGQLEVSFNPAKKSWQLYSTLLDQTGRPLCQISCGLEFAGEQGVKIKNWTQI